MIKSKTIPILYEKKENCSGCTACYAICPKEAISMVEDEEGFEYPHIGEKMKTTLLIMAAGIGSRFGTGIKQLEPGDDAGHIIMDYSIHDAIGAGFNHVVFIIRKDIEKEFKEVIGDRIASICSAHNVTVDYAFQDINDIRENFRQAVQSRGEPVRLCLQRRT